MYKKIKKAVVAGVATMMLTAGGIGVSAIPAQAACTGENVRNQITVDTAEVKMDSCAANGLVNAYSDVQNSTALAAFVGANYPAVSFLSAPFFAWAWANQSTVRDCAANNTGVTFTEINGIIINCNAQ